MTETEKHPLWQGLMDAAYDRWNTEGDLKSLGKHDFVAALPEPHKSAVLLGNYNYQVGNGGHAQFIENDYARDIGQLIEVVNKIGTPSAIAVSLMLEQILPLLDFDSPSLFGDGEEEESDLCRLLDKFDDAFYKLSDSFMYDVEMYLHQLSHVVAFEQSAKGVSDAPV